ncbi:MAG: alpha/beta hydrolase, partial [Paraburkholderia hospita]
MENERCQRFMDISQAVERPRRLSALQRRKSHVGGLPASPLSNSHTATRSIHATEYAASRVKYARTSHHEAFDMFSEPARRSLLAAAWIALALTAANCAQAAANTTSSRQNAPVAHVADQAMRVRTPDGDGDGTLPLYADRNIDAAEPHVTRVF